MLVISESVGISRTSYSTRIEPSASTMGWFSPKRKIGQDVPRAFDKSLAFNGTYYPSLLAGFGDRIGNVSLFGEHSAVE
jgi:hypothetical protein